MPEFKLDHVNANEFSVN